MWARIANAALGIWLMAAPAVLGYGGAARTNDRIVGPIAAAFATIAIWEVTRSVRFVNVALGGWLLLAPWILGHAPAATVNSLVVGALLIGFALVRGTVEQRFGGGWSALLPSHTVPEEHPAGGEPR